LQQKTSGLLRRGEILHKAIFVENLVKPEQAVLLLRYGEEEEE
jgi:hypothetical protein